MKSDYQERYDRFWKGKYCRRAGDEGPFKLVVRVELCGPPSFFYGDVWLHFEDGTEVSIGDGVSFKPRKSDVEVKK